MDSSFRNYGFATWHHPIGCRIKICSRVSSIMDWDSAITDSIPQLRIEIPQLRIRVPSISLIFLNLGFFLDKVVQVRNYGLFIAKSMAILVKSGERWLGGQFCCVLWLFWPISPLNCHKDYLFLFQDFQRLWHYFLQRCHRRYHSRHCIC